MKSIKEGIEEHKAFKKELKEGKSQGLKTPYNNLNARTNNGLPWNTVTTIAALSGVGKTSMMINICLSAPILNPNTSVLVFLLEMPTRAIIARRLSNIFGNSVKQVNSPDYEIDYSVLNDIENLPIHFDETGGTPTEIYNKADNYIKKQPAENNILIAIDHSLLVDGNDDNVKISELCRLINKLKLRYKNVSFLMISQLNDSVMKEERIDRKGILLFPKYTDLYYGRTLFQASDTVLVLNNPSSYLEEKSGSNAWKEYGGYGLFTKPEEYGSKKPIIYGHIIKGRDTGTGIIRWANELETNNLVEDRNFNVSM